MGSLEFGLDSLWDSVDKLTQDRPMGTMDIGSSTALNPDTAPSSLDLIPSSLDWAFSSLERASSNLDRASSSSLDEELPLLDAPWFSFCPNEATDDKLGVDKRWSVWNNSVATPTEAIW